MINKFSSELESTNSNDIIKVAGIISNLKNWIYGFLDPSYKDRVKDLEFKFSEIEPLMEVLYNSIKELQSAIKSGDIAKYNSNLEEVKLQVSELNKSLVNVESTIENSRLPEDVKLSRPISEVKNVHTSNKVKSKTIPTLEESLQRSNLEDEDIKLILSDPDVFFDYLESAIPGGVLEKVVPAKATEKRQNRDGELWLFIVCEFKINENIYCKTRVMCTDLHNRDNAKYSELAIMRITNIRFSTVKNASINKEARNSSWWFDEKKLKDSAAEYSQGNYREAVKTQMSGIDVIKAFVKAWEKVFGEKPTKDTIKILYAQTALETGHFKSMYNYNFGNVKAFPKDKFIALSCGEVVNGKEYKFPKGHPACFFKAYDSAEEGAEAYIKFFTTKHYSKTLSALQSGDMKDFVDQAKKSGYFTADKTEYYDTMTKIDFEKALKGKSDPKAKPEIKPEAKPPEIKMPEVKAPEVKPEELSGSSILNAVVNFFSSAEARPLSTIVKNAIAHQTLPKHRVVISISSKTSMDSKIKYADSLSDILSNSIHADSSIYLDGKKVNILCEATGDKLLLKNAINKVSEIYSNLILECERKVFNHEIYFSDNELENQINESDILNSNRKSLIEEML